MLHWHGVIAFNLFVCGFCKLKLRFDGGKMNFVFVLKMVPWVVSGIISVPVFTDRPLNDIWLIAWKFFNYVYKMVNNNIEEKA